MIAFVGGPADGQTAEVPVAPFYVRVAIEPEVGAAAPLRGTEAPRDGEEVAVYVRPGEVLRQGDGRGGTTVAAATYVWVEDAPADELRDPGAWQRWALSAPPAGEGRVGETRWPPPAADRCAVCGNARALHRPACVVDGVECSAFVEARS